MNSEILRKEMPAGSSSVTGSMHCINKGDSSNGVYRRACRLRRVKQDGQELPKRMYQPTEFEAEKC